MPPRLPIGISSFRAIREDGFVYVDKTALVQKCLDAGAQALLLPRPRRFGKTLGLSTLRCFLALSPDNLAPLFEGLAIFQAGEPYRRHFQRYPAIYLTFKDVKKDTWDACLSSTAGLLAELYGEHRYLLEGSLQPDEAEAYNAILFRRASEEQYAEALRNLSRYLFLHHREKVVILIDEYDTPLHSAFTAGYYDSAITFFRAFLSGGLKDNDYLFKSVLTGILRVAKESVFSGLNNLAVHSLLHADFATCFGFTEPEVAALTEQLGQPGLMDGLRRWYNGYLFGGQVIYNPWSVLNFLSSSDKEYRPYWASSSSNDLVRQLLLDQGHGFSGEMEALLAEQSIEKPIEENVALREVNERPGLVWSFLLFSGYLKVLGTRTEKAVLHATLAIPNEEVSYIYRNIFHAWIEKALGGDRRRDEFLRALLAGECELLEEHLEHWLLHSASYQDTAQGTPERFYHGLVLGLLVSLSSRYEVRSNLESGRGRCDILLLPRSPGQPGVALELKTPNVRRRETASQALKAALMQLEEKDYAAALRARGAEPIHELAVVFSGKRVTVKARAQAADKKARGAGKGQRSGAARGRSR